LGIILGDAEESSKRDREGVKDAGMKFVEGDMTVFKGADFSDNERSQ